MTQHGELLADADPSDAVAREPILTEATEPIDSPDQETPDADRS